MNPYNPTLERKAHPEYTTDIPLPTAPKYLTSLDRQVHLWASQPMGSNRTNFLVPSHRPNYGKIPRSGRNYAARRALFLITHERTKQSIREPLMVALLSPGRTQEGTPVSTAPAAAPSVANEAIATTAVDPRSIRQSIGQQAGLAALKNQDLVNYAYLVLMKEKGHTAPNAYEHAAAKLEKMFGVKLNEIERMDARQASSQIRITDVNREILASRFGVGAAKPEAPAQAPDTITGQKMINDLYARAKEIQHEYGANAGRLVGARSNDRDAIVNRLAEIAGIKEETGHTIWEIANSHRTDAFSSATLDRANFGKELASVISANHAALSRSREEERARSRDDDRAKPRSREQHNREVAKPEQERTLQGKEYNATTVIEPGGRVFKHVRDTITDPQGNPVVVVDRTRINLGPLSFNLPGREYKVSDGVPQDQAKEMAKEYIRNSYRRN